MSKNLVIVESPAKAKTIEKFLGKNFKVIASYGHVRDLPKSKLGVDVDHGFVPNYIIPRAAKKHVSELKSALKRISNLYLATDPDREGEAIAWHISELVRADENRSGFPIKRITFHEITKKAIEDALNNSRDIDQDLVNAQQARRILDRLVGYKLSPFLWRKVRRGLSAGRVQSVAVRLIVEREREVDKFVPREFWKIIAHLNSKKNEEFDAELNLIDGVSAEINNETEASDIKKEMLGLTYAIKDVNKKEVVRHPAAPFTTSTLQQESSRKLGFSAKKTMMIAQQLYEGINLGEEGHIGLITYMRTDSLNLAQEAILGIREEINKKYGDLYLPASPNIYKTKTRGAQEAHEAIRPTRMSLEPAQLKLFLSRDQSRLYELVWKRTLACQMKEAVFDATVIDVAASKYELRATGQVIKFDGFLKVYTEGKDEDENDKNGGSQNILPEVHKDDEVKLLDILTSQHFTKPPARFSEASLVKALEAYGIGRPSTYAPIMYTIVERGYVEKKEKKFYATEIGKIVNDLLVEHFPKIVDIDFTAKMEETLDDIAEGKIGWVPVIQEFWEPFIKNLEQKESEIKKEDIIKPEKTDEICELCGAPMVIRFGRYGKFLACSKFPECKNTKPINETPEEQKEVKDEKCEKCGANLVIKKSRYGDFLACSNYPTCKYTKSIGLPQIKMKCPKCNTGDVVVKKTKRGKIFYGCSRYPDCDWASWTNPTEEKEEKETSVDEEVGADREKKEEA